MVRLFRHHISGVVLLLALVDGLLLAGSARLGSILRAAQIGGGLDTLFRQSLEIAVFTSCTLTGLMVAGAYAPDSFRSGRTALMRLMRGLSLGALGLAVLYLAFPVLALWRSSAVIALILAGGLLLANRAAARLLGGKQLFAQRLLVLGTGPRAQRLARVAEGSGAIIVGYVQVEKGPPALADALQYTEAGILAEDAARLKATEVVLALEERRNALPVAALVRLRTTGLPVTDLTSYLERETGRIDLRSTSPSALFFSDGFVAGRRLSSFAKRSFDVVAALLLLVTVWPLLLAAMVLILLTDTGPVFFRQTRVGLYGAPFSLIKLRTMRIDAEADGQARWADVADPRITPIGRWLRQSRLDELPQLWNVLKGEMSFVGPRPERPEFVCELEDKLIYYAERHMVKPGITGWAQINYPYGASLQDARAKLEYDLYYAKNYTLFLDLVIILHTVRVVLWPAGAR